jgi:hypothetical protein
LEVLIISELQGAIMGKFRPIMGKFRQKRIFLGLLLWGNIFISHNSFISLSKIKIRSYGKFDYDSTGQQDYNVSV